MSRKAVSRVSEYEQSTNESWSLVRAVERLESLLNMGAMAMLALMMLLGSADVVGRYFFDHPILGTREVLASYFMVGVVWLSIARTERLGGHISVDVAVRRAPAILQAWLLILGRVVALVPIALISVETYQAMVESIGQQTRGSIELYVAPSWGLTFVGAAVLVLTICSRIIVDLSRLVTGGTAWK